MLINLSFKVGKKELKNCHRHTQRNAGIGICTVLHFGIDAHEMYVTLIYVDVVNTAGTVLFHILLEDLEV